MNDKEWTLPTLQYHLEAMAAERDRRYTSELEWVRREAMLVAGMAKEATAIAADEAKERLKAHNGLLEKMGENEKKFANRESVEIIQKFMYYMMGGMILLGVIGVANLVKLWTP